MEIYRRRIAYQDKATVDVYVDKFLEGEAKQEHDATTEALKAALDFVSPLERVLDLPCGTGRYASLLHERGYAYVGADVSMEMMEVLVQRREKDGGALALVRCLGEALPFKSDSFDSVVCVRLLNHHIPSGIRRMMLREMRRVSKSWLIVQSHRLKPLGPLSSLKVRIRKLFRGNISKYQIVEEILSEGWIEKKRIPIHHKPFYIGVYNKKP